jgi:hypothetical protein
MEWLFLFKQQVQKEGNPRFILYRPTRSEVHIYIYSIYTDCLNFMFMKIVKFNMLILLNVYRASSYECK